MASIRTNVAKELFESNGSLGLDEVVYGLSRVSCTPCDGQAGSSKDILQGHGAQEKGTGEEVHDGSGDGGRSVRSQSRAGAMENVHDGGLFIRRSAT